MTRIIRGMDIPQAKQIPIFAAIANAFNNEIDFCMQSSMNDHLAKPIDEKLLIEKIAQYIKHNKK